MFDCSQGENFARQGSIYYWSVTGQNCILCPTLYTSGYGILGQYQNPVTNRCYYVENTNAVTYTAASAKCTGAGGYLFPIGTTFEFAMAAYWTGNIRNYWLYGSLSGGTWNTANSQTFSSTSLFWCLSIYSNAKKDF